MLAGMKKGDDYVNPLEKFLEERFKDDFTQSNIWQIPVPEEMISKSYDKLFKFLLDKKLLALGLYRLAGASDNKYPYVCTNPAASISLSLRDRVFVLGHHIRRELLIENNRDLLLVEGNGNQNNQPLLNQRDRKNDKWSIFTQQHEELQKKKT